MPHCNGPKPERRRKVEPFLPQESASDTMATIVATLLLAWVIYRLIDKWILW